MVIFGIPAALQQHRYSPIIRDAPRGLEIEWTRIGIVAAILVVAILANVIANLRFPALLDHDPGNRAGGLGGDLGHRAAAPPGLGDHAGNFKGTIFLLAWSPPPR